MEFRKYNVGEDSDPTGGGRQTEPFRFQGMPKVLGPSRKVMEEGSDRATPQPESPTKELRVDPWDMHTWPPEGF